ncbi:hypothetical protein [Nocardia sp. NPDC047038]|uniref:hypothetical protein n=1 Tax=Nocardia sp. NPDC047038 TaxID=3154338 RepID=UPI0033C3D991
MPIPRSDELISLIAAVAEHKGYLCTATEDRTQVEFIGPCGDGPHILRLDTLCRILEKAPLDQWLTLVADHVGLFLAQVDLEYTYPLDINDLATVRGRLRTRFAPDDSELGTGIVRRDIAPGIIQIVVISQPLAVVVVTTDVFTNWEIDHTELFDLAEANTRAEGSLDIEWWNCDDAHFAILSNSSFASAHARWLGDYPVIGTHGALFVTSHEGCVYTHPIIGPDALTAITMLGKTAATTFRNEPRPISPRVYWWKDSKIILAATTEIDEDGAVDVHQTPEFDALLTSLAVTCEFGVIPVGDIGTAFAASEWHQQMCTGPDDTSAPPTIRDLVAEIERGGAAVGFDAVVADSRGAVLRTWGPGRGQQLYTVLDLTKDRDLAVLDVENGQLYDPRGHADVRVTVGDGRRLPYLTAPLLEDFMVATADPDDPFLLVARADETYIRMRRHEWMYEMEYRAGSATENFRFYTVLYSVVRDVIWEWACGDPSWKVAVQWRRVDPESPGIESASWTELLQNQVSATGVTLDAIALAETLLPLVDIPIPLVSSARKQGLEIDPSTLRGLGSEHAAQGLPVSDAEEARFVAVSDDPEYPERRTPDGRHSNENLAAVNRSDWTSHEPESGHCVLMLYKSASRAAAVLTLNIEDLDVANKQAKITAKGGHTMWITQV